MTNPKDEFMSELRERAAYWTRIHPESAQGIDGMCFGICTMIDGCSGNFYVVKNSEGVEQDICHEDWYQKKEESNA